VHCRKEGHINASVRELRNMSYGGLSFVSDEHYAPGDVLEVAFPDLRHPGHVRGEIVWSEALDANPGSYLHGLKFLDENEHHRARLIEQICHIESYRRTQELHYGRSLAPQVAAEEWIAKYAARFPT
jgi:hypothetical protein